MSRFIVGVSGASGIILAVKTISALANCDHDVDVVFSQHALYTARFELGKNYATVTKIIHSLPPNIQKKITVHPIVDMGASICSGSYKNSGMVVVPCSMATVAAISMGLSDNVLRRAADVSIKEKRPLILVPRETPFSEIHLENLLRLSKMGVSILPPIPAWYNAPKNLDDIENFIVGKILDLFHIEHSLYPPWNLIKENFY